MDTDGGLVDEQLGEQLALKLFDSMRGQGRQLVLAESCTGGWIAKLLTDLPGSSAVFCCSFVTYSNQAKQRMLGVPQALLQRHGAVSAEVVTAMADGALSHSDANLAGAVSGIAGPGGGSDLKPVGTVWFAISNGSQPTKSWHRQFSGDRRTIRIAAACELLRALCDGEVSA